MVVAHELEHRLISAVADSHTDRRLQHLEGLLVFALGSDSITRDVAAVHVAYQYGVEVHHAHLGEGTAVVLPSAHRVAIAEQPGAVAAEKRVRPGQFFRRCIGQVVFPVVIPPVALIIQQQTRREAAEMVAERATGDRNQVKFVHCRYVGLVVEGLQMLLFRPVDIHVGGEHDRLVDVELVYLARLGIHERVFADDLAVVVPDFAGNDSPPLFFDVCRESGELLTEARAGGDPQIRQP